MRAQLICLLPNCCSLVRVAREMLTALPGQRDPDGQILASVDRRGAAADAIVVL